MQFSDTATRQGIIQACERYTNLGKNGISGDADRLADFTAHINETMRKIWHVIFLNSGNWEYDDGNQTGSPSATQTLTSGTSTYTLPTETLAVKRIDIKDANGIWYKLDSLAEYEIKQGLDEFYKTDGNPKYYRLIGNTIELFPGPNYTLANALKVSFDRGSVGFEAGDTTETPGFASEYHGAVARGAAAEYLNIKFPGEAIAVKKEQEFQQDLINISNFYQKRHKDLKPRISRRHQSFK